MCWGDNSLGQTDAPGNRFTEVSAAMWHSCGLLLDETVMCWGGLSLLYESSPEQAEEPELDN